MDEEDTFEINFSCGVKDNRLDNSLLEQWTILLGKEINSRREVKGSAADSSRFKNRQAYLWSLLKWSKVKEH